MDLINETTTVKNLLNTLIGAGDSILSRPKKLRLEPGMIHLQSH